jgi:hypothetical protein
VTGRGALHWLVDHPTTGAPPDRETLADRAVRAEPEAGRGGPRAPLPRYPLFLTGLVYEEPGGPLRRAAAVGTRDGDLVPLEVTDALLDTLRTVAARHERGFMVEHLMELLA